MNDEFDSTVDTSFDDTSSDITDSSIGTDSVDVGSYLDDTVDVSDADDFFEDSADVESLMSDVSDTDSIITMDTVADVDASDVVPLVDDVASDSTSNIDVLMADTGEDESSFDTAGDLTGEFNDSSTDVEALMDDTSDVSTVMDALTDLDTEIPTDAAIEGVSDVPPEIDYDAVYSGLDSYDFDGVDVSTDMERLDSSLENFQSGTWENLSTNEQKAAMSDLADYVKDVIGFENPPDIVYYNNPVDGDYGGYSPGTNTLSVNEYMLYDNNEAADTIAHELWHAYQHERAMNPQSAKDYQYQYGFDNYIRPDDDFTAYQEQLVEAEARAFAQQFKDRLRAKGRGI